MKVKTTRQAERSNPGPPASAAGAGATAHHVQPPDHEHPASSCKGDRQPHIGILKLMLKESARILKSPRTEPIIISMSFSS